MVFSQRLVNTEHPLLQERLEETEAVSHSPSAEIDYMPTRGP